MKLSLDEVLGIKEELRLTSLYQFAIITLTDRSGVIVDCNDAFLKISKFSREEVLGKTHQIINSGEHPKKFWKEMWQGVARGEVWRADIKNKAKDGSIYWVDTQISSIKNESDDIVGFLSIRYDITEQKQKEVELEKQNLLLENLRGHSRASSGR